MERRDFLKFFSAGVLGPFFTNIFSLKQKTVEYLIPYVVPPVGVIPGVANWYSSVCRQCPAGCGIQVKIREGRAKKIEGNPLCPVNRGRLCARGQAGLQVLYNPDRITGPMIKTAGGFRRISWGRAESILAGKLSAIRDKGLSDRVVFLTEPLRGSLAKLISTFAGSYGSSQVIAYEFFGDEALAEANERCFGHRGLPDYDLSNTRYILSLGTNFLDTWTSPVKHSVGYGEMRDRASGTHGERGWLAQFEPRLSVTGASADEWFPIKPETEGLVALAIAHVIVSEGRQDPSVGQIDTWKQVLGGYSPKSVAEKAGVPGAALLKVARRFASSRPAVALCGGSATAQTNGVLNAVAANILNYLVGAVGNEGGVRFPSAPVLGPAVEPTVSHERLQELSTGMGDGDVEAVFIYNTNPVFNLPAGYRFAENLARVPLVVSFSSFMDETTAEAGLILPDATYLESWGDYVPLTDDGRRVTGLMQPAVTPLHDTRQVGDVVLSLAAALGGPSAAALPFATFPDYLKASWQGVYDDARARGLTAQTDFDSFWDESLERGGWWEEQPSFVPPARQPAPELLSELAGEADGREAEPEYEFHLWPYPSHAMYDGRGANQPWLQQLPEPLVTAAWGSWAEINPETARELEVGEGDLLEIESPAGKITVPAYVYPAIEPKTIAVAVGQGHRAYGRYARDRGQNPLRILEPVNDKQSGALAWASTKVKVSKVGASEAIVKTEPDQDLPGIEHGVRELGREIVQWVGPEEGDKLARRQLEPIKALPTRDLKPGPHFLSGLGLGKYRTSRFQDYKYRWGMVIDLDKCTGCSTCMVACYAENNLPIVSPTELLRRRHKNWIRVDRYWEGEYPNVRAKAVPINCMQCGNAPCEPVCPVYASFHSKDGLNGQVYQRCIGTRYCNANCPYRSRLFNWFNPDWPEPLNQQLNTDISVRSSGMTDKCSFCVQRIRVAKDKAKDEDRRVADGEIQPACVQTCPTGAMAFGDLLDPNTRVSKLTRDPRRYRMLEEFNTEPAVIYLKAVRQGAEAEAGKGGEHEPRAE